MSVIKREQAIKDVKRKVLSHKWGREVSTGNAGTRFANYEAGDVIMQQGDEGTEMYYVQRGELDVFVNKQKVHTLREGDFFGEFALLYGGKRRSATILATSYCRLMALGLEALEVVNAAQTRAEHSLATHRATVISPTKIESAPVEVTTASLGLFVKEFKHNEKVVSAGDRADTMYFIAKGQVSVQLPNSDVATLRKGAFFGENGLRNGQKRNASVLSDGTSLVWVITRASLERVLEYRPEFSTQFSYHDGAMVVKEGEPAKFMFYVLNGELDVVLKDGTRVHRVRQGDFFGESGLRQGCRRTASVECASDCTLSVFSTDDLERIITYHSQYGMLESAGQADGSRDKSNVLAPRHTMKSNMNMDKEIRIKAKLQETLLRFKKSQDAQSNSVLGAADSDDGYHEQGDESMYTIESLMQRAALVDHPTVVRAVKRHWQLWDLDGSNGISRDEYVELNMMMQKALVEDLDLEQAKSNAEMDWARDVDNGEDMSVMSYDQFRDSMFEVADIWVDEIDPNLYSSFLDDLLAAVAFYDETLGKWSCHDMEEIVCVADELRGKYTSAQRGSSFGRKGSKEGMPTKQGRRKSIDEFLVDRGRAGRRKSMVYYTGSSDDEEDDEEEALREQRRHDQAQAALREEMQRAAQAEAAKRVKENLERSLKPHSLNSRSTMRMGQRLASISDDELHAALVMMRRENDADDGQQMAQPEVVARRESSAFGYIATTGGGNRGCFQLGEEFNNPAVVASRMGTHMRSDAIVDKYRAVGGIWSGIHKGNTSQRDRLPRVIHSASRTHSCSQNLHTKQTTANKLQLARSVPHFNRRNDPQLNRLAQTTKDRLPMLFGHSTNTQRRIQFQKKV
jgi:CRP-like cAMP-binding protein